MTERLQKLLSQRGIASRRQAEKLILGVRVTVNGKVAEIGQQADGNCDRICVDGKEIGEVPRCTYLLLHKPTGVVSTCQDPQGRKTVLDLLDDSLKKGVGIHPVGRLDAGSTGALLLTNDGNLTYKLTHPRHQLPKVYRVWVRGIPTDDNLQKWRSGVLLDGRKTLPAKVFRIAGKAVMAQSNGAQSNGKTDTPSRDDEALLEVTLTEGRNRQIRRVAESLGYPVTALHRIKIGSLSLGKLPRGRYRLLRDVEVAQLKHEADLTLPSIPSKI